MANDDTSRVTGSNSRAFSSSDRRTSSSTKKKGQTTSSTRHSSSSHPLFWHKSKSRSTGRSLSSRRRKKKAEALPADFEAWDEESQNYYNEISALLRDAKATRRQCSYKRNRVSVWRQFKMNRACHNLHAQEMKIYTQTKKEFKPVDKEESLDLDI